MDYNIIWLWYLVDSIRIHLANFFIISYQRIIVHDNIVLHSKLHFTTLTSYLNAFLIATSKKKSDICCEIHYILYIVRIIIQDIYAPWSEFALIISAFSLSKYDVLAWKDVKISSRLFEGLVILAQ